MSNLAELLRSGKATIVDVRSPGEFMGGHVVGSINIPLQQIPNRLEEFKKMKNIVLCCASGGRSGQATMLLQQNGIECQNAGSWLDVNAHC
jgi:phage shock protein E